MDGWQQVAAIASVTGMVVGGYLTARTGAEKRDSSSQQNMLRLQEEILDIQKNIVMVTQKLTFLIEQGAKRQEELYRDTHLKLDRITDNQEKVIQAVNQVAAVIMRN